MSASASISASPPPPCSCSSASRSSSSARDSRTSWRRRTTMSEIAQPLDAATAAMGRGDWQAARIAFDASLRIEERPDALEGLGHAAWWLDLADDVFDARERAYRLYREGGDVLG